MIEDNRSWNLESFIDALVVELDKTRETLAVKAINKPLSYTVKDMSLDLQIFPTYTGDEVKFVTAKPGENGASKITLQLASITDQQVRVTSKRPASKEDIRIDNIEIDPETKKTLRKIGITSVKDLEEFENKNVDLEKVAPAKFNYKELANLIQKTKRGISPPKVNKVSMAMSGSVPILYVEGENLALHKKFEPVAVINQQLAEVKSYSRDNIQIVLSQELMQSGNNELIITLDPYSVFKLNINS